MITTFALLFSVWVKFFFLFTPFFALSMFLSLTTGYTEPQRRRLVLRVTLALIAVCLLLYFFGNLMFRIFGFTVDAFRVGAGALLFLSAAGMVQRVPQAPAHTDEDIAVVPMAVPVIAGPATIGTLLVMGADVSAPSQKAIGCAALLLAIGSVAGVLLVGTYLERVLGKRGINILSKLTGLILAALAAQMILQGVTNAIAAARPL